jgi:hypothetical protein
MRMWLPRARRPEQCLNAVQLSTHPIEARSLPRDLGTHRIEPNALLRDFGAQPIEPNALLRDLGTHRIEPNALLRDFGAQPIEPTALPLDFGAQPIEPNALPLDFGAQPIEPNSLPGDFGAQLNQLKTVLSERRFEQGHQAIDPRFRKRLEIADPVVEHADHLVHSIQDRAPKYLVLRADRALFGQNRPKLPADPIEADDIAHAATVAGGVSTILPNNPPGPD